MLNEAMLSNTLPQSSVPIIIAAYNRPESLLRLLNSVNNADYSGFQNVPLLISIDHSGNDDCATIARQFEWMHGDKQVIVHTQKLGLKQHILNCGDLSVEYGAAIVLEDDLFVAKGFYQYAIAANSFYNKDLRIAGIGLYNYRYNEFASCPFEPILDKYDIYFLQIPCSWGQLWSSEQWISFRDYLNNPNSANEHLMMPDKSLEWPIETSWKRSYLRYMISTNKYFVYPRMSLSTNFGDVGQHYESSVLIWQTALLHGEKNYVFGTLENTLPIYDSFFELSGSTYNKICNTDIDVSFDLNGTKPLAKVKTKYLISSKVTLLPIEVYQAQLYPFENNILYNLFATTQNDKSFTLAHSSDFISETNFRRINHDVNRTFMGENVLAEVYRNEILTSTTYKIGKLILSPFVFFKKLFKKAA